jgi:hypothetical protein
VLLLDIDGVLNGHPRRCGWDGPPRRLKVGMPVYYEPQVVKRLRAINASGMVKVRWCTTWCGIPYALADLSRELDLPFEPAFGSRPMSKTWGDMKVEAALAVLEDGRRLIWVDDEEAPAARRLFPASAEAEREGRALLVEPVSELGLRPEHFTMIDRFVGRSLSDTPNLQVAT